MAPNVTSGPAGQMSPVVSQGGVIPQGQQLVNSSNLPATHFLICSHPSQQVPVTQPLSLSVPIPIPLMAAPQAVPTVAPYPMSPPTSVSSGATPPPALLPPQQQQPPPQQPEMLQTYVTYQQVPPQAPSIFQYTATGEVVHMVPVPMGMPVNDMYQVQQQQQQQQQEQQQPSYQCSQQMEVVWHTEFNNLFQQLSGEWQLVPTLDPPEQSVPDKDWNKFTDSAKVRFCCQKCGKGWTSMKGRVAFWFTWDGSTNSGIVTFKLYGQMCERCQDGITHAMWYPEEVQKVINNIFNRVGQVYYGFQTPHIRVDRRAGKPRSQHNSRLCLACRDGVCLSASQQERATQ